MEVPNTFGLGLGGKVVLNESGGDGKKGLYDSGVSGKRGLGLGIGMGMKATPAKGGTVIRKSKSRVSGPDFIHLFA